MSVVARLPRHYRVDASADAILLSDFDGAISDDELEDYLREVDAIHRRRKLHAVIVDARTSTRPTSAQRARVGEWMRANERVFRTWTSSFAFVVLNPLVRGALTAIFWLSPAPVPTLFTGDIEEARRWSLEQLAHREG